MPVAVPASLAAVLAARSPREARLEPHGALGGLFLATDFLSADEEAALLAWCDAQRPGWKLRNFNGPARGQRWGVVTDLKLRTVHAGDPMPRRVAAYLRVQVCRTTTTHNDANTTI